MNRFQQDAGFHQYVQLKTVIFGATHYSEGLLKLDWTRQLWDFNFATESLKDVIR